LEVDLQDTHLNIEVKGEIILEMILAAIIAILLVENDLEKVMMIIKMVFEVGIKKVDMKEFPYIRMMNKVYMLVT
jgi:hypothetical protein